MSSRTSRAAAAGAGRVTVITGMGVVAPSGVGTDAFWKATREGVSFLDAITREGCEGLPLRVAGQVRGFDAATLVEDRYLVQTDRFSHFAMAAAEMALADAGLSAADARSPYAVGVVTAAGSGGGEFGQRELQQLWGRGPRFVGPYQSIAWFYAATTGQISIRHGMKGACGVLVGEQAGGLDALGQTRRALVDDASVVISGGTDAPLSPYALTCHIAGGQLTGGKDPATAYRPFDAGAGGYVAGEGGAIFVLEREDRWRARGTGRPGYGELAGYAATFDPPPGSGREPGLRRAITLALADAGAADRKSVV